MNFCVGDWFYWLGRPAINYRGSFAQWSEFLKRLVVQEKVTGIIYYGDSRPYHRVAADVAASLGVHTYAYEFGYLRPDWITLERGGMSGRSHFPADPDAIRAIGAKFPRPEGKPRFHYTMSGELTHEIFYNLSSYFLYFTFPRYQADRYYNPIIEYLTGVPKQIRAGRAKAEAQDVVKRLVDDRCRFFLFPLQLQNDYQLRSNAEFAHQSDAIRTVIASFARHAAADDRLVLKCHPLDNGGENWPTHIKKAATAAGVADRVAYIEGGDLAVLLDHASGTITINSTVGMHALVSGGAVKVLGTALFDIEGLTHQGSLDTFWTSPMQPDMGLVDALVRALAGTIQVRGDFFSREGRKAAIEIFVERLTTGSVNGGGAFVNPPPRLTARSLES